MPMVEAVNDSQNVPLQASRMLWDSAEYQLYY